jgi:murein DD-endopeptidase MepM/ murein hydrolase activator NlpD
MRISAAAFFMILTTIFLSACGKTEMASLEDRGNNFYSRNGVMSLAGAAMPTQQAVPTMSAASSDLAPANQVPMPIASTWQWPVQGKVTETFGQKADGISNEGIVIAATEGSPIHAAQAGEVAYVGNDAKTFGNIVIIRHADGDMTSYSHARNIIVTKGERVNAGSVIAYVGQSGSAKQPQLHFAVRENRMAVDPLSKLPHQFASN